MHGRNIKRNKTRVLHIQILISKNKVLTFEVLPHELVNSAKRV